MRHLERSERQPAQSTARGGHEQIIAKAPHRVLLERLVWASAFLVTTIVVSVLVSGCGGDVDREPAVSASASSSPQSDRTYRMPDAEVARVESEAIEAEPAHAAGTVATPQPTAGAMESWPPDLSVSVSDTVAAPGEVVEVVAEATSDVVEIALTDGIGQSEPFYLDRAQGVWRATYRVPLKPRWERTGLSVTAKNDAGRWRRVWVFVRAQSPQLQELSTPAMATDDSATHDESEPGTEPGAAPPDVDPQRDDS